MDQTEGPGDRIAQALKAAGLRAADLARRAKVSPPTVHSWINSKHGISWANVRRAAAVLGVPASWIMFGTNEEAERMAQTGDELSFLRLYRDLSDEDQAALLRFLNAMHRSPPPKSPPPKSPPLARGRTVPNEQDEYVTPIPLNQLRRR
jgi:transcriptional regulator with XRE-family HTH domain